MLLVGKRVNMKNPIDSNYQPEITSDVLDSYQQAFKQTRGEGNDFAWALGLSGESGEVADLIKKLHFHGGFDKKGPITPQRIMEETGDVIWYAAALLDYFGYTLADAMISNREKLRKRHPQGFSVDSARTHSDEGT